MALSQALPQATSRLILGKSEGFTSLLTLAIPRTMNDGKHSISSAGSSTM